MKQLLARRERHGWSWAELSRRSGLPVWKLRWWGRRLVGKRPARGHSGAFVAVEIVNSPREKPSPVEVITASGVRIVVPVGFEPDHLRRVMKAVEPAC
jgi:hypothetical protein